MPTNLSSIPGKNQKRLKLLALLVLSPLIFHAQTLTGLWIGALSNDSSTIRKDQSFEIALTEYKGKVYGYSRSEFIVDDVLYFVVKRVKGTIEGDICEVEDDEIIAYNFRGKLDKKVKVTSIFRRNRTDSSWYLDGTWKTNQTKNYYTLTGKVSLEEEKDLTASKIFPHLEELKIANEVAFYKERKEGTPIVTLAKPETNRLTNSTKPVEILATDKVVAVVKPNLQRADSKSTFVEDEKQPDPIAANTIAKDETKTPVIQTDTKSQLANGVSAQPVAAIREEKQPDPIAANTVVKEETKTPAIHTDTKTFVPNGTSIQPVIATAVNNKKIDDPASTNKTETTTTADNKNPSSNNNTATKVEYSDNSYVDPYTGDIVRPKTNNSSVKKDIPVNKDLATSSASMKPSENKTVPVTKEIAGNKKIEIEPLRNTNSHRENIKIDPITLPAIPVVKTTVAERDGAASFINDRKTEISQVVNFKSDSLQLSLYDNGQIDGDTVSVFMNGTLILAKQGLKASAIKKTIFVNTSQEEFSLVLYAENLGAYPPNTGLLVVRDGDDVYNLRFSADFTKNSGIVFRRKK